MRDERWGMPGAGKINSGGMEEQAQRRSLWGKCVVHVHKTAGERRA